jgi:hypothetical protein
MKHIAAIGIILLPLLGIGQQFDWARTYGGPSDEAMIAIEADPYGNVVILGSFPSTIDVNSSAADTLLFATTTGQGLYVSKLDASGQLVWSEQIGGMDDRLTGSVLGVDSLGNIYIGGEFHDTVDFDPGPNVNAMISDGASIPPGPPWGPPPQYLTDIFLLKLNSNGQFVWARQLDGTSDQNHLTAMTIGNVDDVLILGTCTDTIYFDGPQGQAAIAQPWYSECFVASYSDNGDFQWGKVIGGYVSQSPYSHVVYPTSVVTDADQNVYMTGQWNGTVDFDPDPDTNYLSAIQSTDAFLLSLDPMGNFRWVKALGGLGSQSANSLVISQSDQSIFVFGSFTTVIDLDPGPDTLAVTATQSNYTDAFILSLNMNGVYQWAKTITGTRNKYVYKGDMDSYGNLFLMGMFNGEMDLDPGPEESLFQSPSSSWYSVFLSKFSSSGTFIWGADMDYTSIALASSSIDVNSFGDIFVGCSYRYPTQIVLDDDTVSFGSISNGYYDNMVMKLSSCLIQLPDQQVQACDPYTSPSGDHIWTGSGTYIDVLHRGYGCDTVVNVELEYLGLEPSIYLDLNDLTLVSTETGAVYTWLNCSTDTVVLTTTDSAFELTGNGSYAVVVEQNGCADTSACLSVTGLALNEFLLSGLNIYPNPTTSTLRIQLPDGNLRATQTRLYDMTGRLVLQQPYNPVVDVSALDTGSYILVVETEQGRFRNVIRKE